MQEIIKSNARRHALMNCPRGIASLESAKIEEAYLKGGLESLGHVMKKVEELYDLHQDIDIRDDLLAALHIEHMEKNNQLYEEGLVPDKIGCVSYYTDHYLENRALENPMLLQ